MMIFDNFVLSEPILLLQFCIFAINCQFFFFCNSLQRGEFSDILFSCVSLSGS